MQVLRRAHLQPRQPSLLPGGHAGGAVRQVRALAQAVGPLRPLPRPAGECKLAVQPRCASTSGLQALCGVDVRWGARRSSATRGLRRRGVPPGRRVPFARVGGDALPVLCLHGACAGPRAGWAPAGAGGGRAAVAAAAGRGGGRRAVVVTGDGGGNGSGGATRRRAAGAARSGGDGDCSRSGGAARDEEAAVVMARGAARRGMVAARGGHRRRAWNVVEGSRGVRITGGWGCPGWPGRP